MIAAAGQKFLQVGDVAYANSNFVQFSGRRGHALPRPQEGGPADIVYFGVFVRQFFTMDLVLGTCALDVVLTTEWHDPRAAALVPSGKDSFTVDNNIPNTELWQPRLVFTSRAMDGTEEISNWISVRKTGKVIITQRLLLINKNSYSFDSYPFDTQTLTLILSSATLMLEECVLENVPTAYAKGVKDIAFDNTPLVLENSTQYSFVDISGALRKSRGRVELFVRRRPAAILRKTLMPQLIFVVVAWTTFFLPLAQYAVMPRVATCLIAFLALMTAQVQAGASVPPMAGSSWTGMVDASLLLLVLSTVMLNILIMLIDFDWKMAELAERANIEMRFVYAGMVLVVLIIACVATTSNSFSIWTSIANGFVVVCDIVYAIYLFIRSRHFEKK